MNKAILMTVAACAAMVMSASAADVKENWAKKCAGCHGPDGKGDTKMGKKLEIKDFTDAKYQASLKDEDMLKAIKEGVKNGHPPRKKGGEGPGEEKKKTPGALC